MVISLQKSDGDVIGVVFQKVDLICDYFLQPLDKRRVFSSIITEAGSPWNEFALGQIRTKCMYCSNLTFDENVIRSATFDFTLEVKKT